jgi:hypothetical protein
MPLGSPARACFDIAGRRTNVYRNQDTLADLSCGTAVFVTGGWHVVGLLGTDFDTTTDELEQDVLAYELLITRLRAR